MGICLETATERKRGRVDRKVDVKSILNIWDMRVVRLKSELLSWRWEELELRAELKFERTQSNDSDTKQGSGSRSGDSGSMTER